MKKSFFILTLSVLSITSVLANTNLAHDAAPSSETTSGYAKVTPLVEVEGLAATDVSIQTWTVANPKAVGLTPNTPTYLQTTLTSPQYTFKATITGGTYKGMECWDLYTFAPGKTFTITLYMINNNTACELRGQQTD